VRPADEFVQAAHAADGLVTGAQIKMIRVAENDLGAERFERVLWDSLHRSLRANGHEDGRFDDLMRKNQASAASASCSFSHDLERWGHDSILSGTVASGGADNEPLATREPRSTAQQRQGGR